MLQDADFFILLDLGKGKKFGFKRTGQALRPLRHG
jgi:hypothetical protein